MYTYIVTEVFFRRYEHKKSVAGCDVTVHIVRYIIDQTQTTKTYSIDSHCPTANSRDNKHVHYFYFRSD